MFQLYSALPFVYQEALDVLEPFHLLGFRFALAADFLIMQLCGIVKINLKAGPGQVSCLTLMEPVIYFVCETIGSA